MQKQFSLNKRINRKISSPLRRLGLNGSRKTRKDNQIATTGLGKSPLLRQLGEGLLKLLLGSVGLLLGYGGYLLSPHLRELIYGHFGRPASGLDRAWSWLEERMGSGAKAAEVPEVTKPTVVSDGGRGEEALLEELRKNRGLLEEQQRQLERLSTEQERTADQLRWISTREGAREAWLPFLGKFMVGSGLSSFLGWLFGGRSVTPATRGDLKEVLDNLAQQHTELDGRRASAQLVNDALTAQQFQALNFIESIVRGILHQVNTFAAAQGLRVWIPDLNPGGGHFEDPNGGGNGGGGNPPPAGGPNGPQPPQPQPAAPANGPILEEVGGAAGAGPAEGLMGEAIPAEAAWMAVPVAEVLGAAAVALAVGEMPQPEAVAVGVEAAELPENHPQPRQPDQPESSPVADGVAAMAGVAVGVGVAAQLGAVAVPVAVPVAGGVAAGGVAMAALGAVPAVAVAGVLGLVAAAGVRSALGAGGWMLQRAFGPKPERSPVAMGEVRIPETPQSAGGGEVLQQRVQQLAEGRVAPVRVELAPEARELLGQRVGLDPAQPNLLNEALQRAGEKAAQEEAAQEAARAGFGQRLKEGVQGYWRRLWGQQPRSLGNGGSEPQPEAGGLGQRLDRGLESYWQRSSVANSMEGIQEIRTAAPVVVPQEVVTPSFRPVNPAAGGAGKGMLGNLADYSGFSGLKRSLDDFNGGVQKTVQTINFLWEKKGWAGLALGGAYVGAPLLRVAISMARGRPDAAVGALVRYQVAQQPKGNLEVLAGEAWTGTLERASDPIFMEAMQMAAGVVILAAFKKGGKLQRNLRVYSGGAPKTPFWTPKT